MTSVAASPPVSSRTGPFRASRRCRGTTTLRSTPSAAHRTSSRGEGLIQRQQGHPTRVMRTTADEPTVDELLAKAEAALSAAAALIAAARRAA